MSEKRDPKANTRALVIKREEIVAGGHHGGAWKVAYADFVTAMMAFFLLMWLLNATTEQQRRGIADYFSPISAISRGTSGSGQPFGGHTPYDQGAMVSDLGQVQVTAATKEPTHDTEQDAQNVSAQRTAVDGQGAPTDATDDGNAGNAASGTRAAGQAAWGDQHLGAAQTSALTPNLADQPNRPDPVQEQAAFHRAAQQIRDAVAHDPALADVAKQLAIDETPEGLRIQLMDEDKHAMFAFGSSVPNDRARALLQKVAPVLMKLSEDVAITGHTDAAPYRGGDRTNWELSTDRANATRRLLVDAGLPEGRFRTVSGDADRDLLLPGDPLNAANRRMAIVVLRRARAPSAAAVRAPAAAPNAVAPAATQAR